MNPSLQGHTAAATPPDILFSGQGIHRSLFDSSALNSPSEHAVCGSGGGGWEGEEGEEGSVGKRRGGEGREGEGRRGDGGNQ